MKKSVVIFIAIIYVASIVSINFFGMKMSVYNEQIPVERIECTNESDPERGIIVDEKNGLKRITITYRNPADINDPVNTSIIQIFARVYPENATFTRVRYQYHITSKNAVFYKDAEGHENGIVLFYGPLGQTKVDLVSTDGRNIITSIYIRAVPAT